MATHQPGGRLSSAAFSVPILDAYAATQCPRRTHNNFDPTIPNRTVDDQINSEIQGRLDAASAFRVNVRSQLGQLHGPDCTDLTAHQLPGQAVVDATVAAMDAGAKIILGGQLPDDRVGGRRGRPDALVRIGSAGSSACYLPVDIKNHKALTASRTSSATARVSRLAEPAFESSEHIAGFAHRKHTADSLQLMHYWRILDAIGRAPNHPSIGGIIGADVLADGPVIVWHHLDLPTHTPITRSPGDTTSRQSIADLYEDEFEFRSRIAVIAQAQTGTSTDPRPLVEPVIVKECDTCPWSTYCRNELGPFDASALVGRLSAREWLALRARGYRDVTDLASLDPAVLSGCVSSERAATVDALRTQQFVDEYLQIFDDQPKARRRLRDATLAAQMIIEGRYIERIDHAPIGLPRADIEIDFDIENDRSAQVYLWGILVTDRAAGTSNFEHTTNWEPLNATTEAHLALQFWKRLREIVDSARQDDKSVLIYHYSTPEPKNLQRIAREALVDGLPTTSCVNALIDESFVDLYPIMRSHYFGREGLSLKVTATRAAGFTWRDEDPGGLQSISWLERLQAGDVAMKQRILEYNEDDVRATWVLRNWLSEQD